MTQPVEVSHDWSADMWDWPLQHTDGVVKVVNTAEKFEVALEAQCFTPKEVSVMVAGDDLVIHCLHEERSDQHGTVKREVHRSYRLPDDVDKATIKTSLSTRGILHVSAQKKA